MHYPLVYTLLAAVAGSLVSAQDLSQIPTCAQQAAISSIGSSGCQLTDFACICRNQAFLDSLLPLVEQSCSADELQRLLSLTQSLCLNAGVTLSAPSAASATSAATSATSAAASASSVAASLTSAAASVSSAVASVASSLSAAASPSTTITPSNSGSQLAGAGGLMAAIAVAAAFVGLN